MMVVWIVARVVGGADYTCGQKNENKLVDMELDTVANIEVDKVADKVAAMVADKVACLLRFASLFTGT